MSLQSLADDVVKRINESLQDRMSEPEIATVSKIVQNALIEAVNKSTKRCSDAAVVCCGPEADLAHKIAEDVERARFALLANLTSMR